MEKLQEDNKLEEKLIQVRVGSFRAVSSYHLEDVICDRDDWIILQEERGLEYGRVLSMVKDLCESKKEKSQGKVLRVATKEDFIQIENNKVRARDALNTCLRKADERKLDMQIIKCEYSFDGSKVIFFFSAEGRIDFRALVKDLSRIFKIRIELKQIGVRDKAKIVGGVGVCGRELCCTSYMKGFHPVSVKMAKDQELPINPSRISGICGRIKCCMAYEFMVYKEYKKELPRAGDKILTPEGRGKVMDVNILKRLVHVDLGEGKRKKFIFDEEYVD